LIPHSRKPDEERLQFLMTAKEKETTIGLESGSSNPEETVIAIRLVNWKNDFESLIPIYANAFKDQVQWFNIFQLTGQAHYDALYWFYTKRLLMLSNNGKITVLVATQNDKVIGAVGIEPNSCGITINQILVLISIIIGLGFRFGYATILRMTKMTGGVKDKDRLGGKVVMMAVHPDFQQIGIGSRLLRRCIDDWDAADGTSLTLMTQLEGSVHFYSKFGFQIQSKIQKKGYSNWNMVRLK
jgi:ribosomal protein S18 acetylase RimI-like enzyme